MAAAAAATLPPRAELSAQQATKLIAGLGARLQDISSDCEAFSCASFSGSLGKCKPVLTLLIQHLRTERSQSDPAVKQATFIALCNSGILSHLTRLIDDFSIPEDGGAALQYAVTDLGSQLSTLLWLLVKWLAWEIGNLTQTLEGAVGTAISSGLLQVLLKLDMAEQRAAEDVPEVPDTIRPARTAVLACLKLLNPIVPPSRYWSTMVRALEDTGYLQHCCEHIMAHLDEREVTARHAQQLLWILNLLCDDYAAQPEASTAAYMPRLLNHSGVEEYVRAVLLSFLSMDGARAPEPLIDFESRLAFRNEDGVLEFDEEWFAKYKSIALHVLEHLCLHNPRWRACPDTFGQCLALRRSLGLMADWPLHYDLLMPAVLPNWQYVSPFVGCSNVLHRAGVPLAAPPADPPDPQLLSRHGHYCTSSTMCQEKLLSWVQSLPVNLHTQAYQNLMDIMISQLTELPLAFDELAKLDKIDSNGNSSAGGSSNDSTSGCSSSSSLASGSSSSNSQDTCRTDAAAGSSRDNSINGRSYSSSSSDCHGKGSDSSCPSKNTNNKSNTDSSCSSSSSCDSDSNHAGGRGCSDSCHNSSGRDQNGGSSSGSGSSLMHASMHAARQNYKLDKRLGRQMSRGKQEQPWLRPGSDRTSQPVQDVLNILKSFLGHDASCHIVLASRGVQLLHALELLFRKVPLHAPVHAAVIEIIGIVMHTAAAPETYKLLQGPKADASLESLLVTVRKFVIYWAQSMQNTKGPSILRAFVTALMTAAVKPSALVGVSNFLPDCVVGSEVSVGRRLALHRLRTVIDALSSGNWNVAWTGGLKDPSVVEKLLEAAKAASVHTATPSVGCWNPVCSNLDGSREAELKLLKCSGCKVALYCCAACQKADWKAHKAGCHK